MIGLRPDETGKARLAPRLHAAVERDRALESHLAQRRRRQRRDSPEFAVDEDAARRIRQFVVDPQLELSARQQTRARDVALLVGVALAYVEDEELVSAAHPVRALSSASDMNGTVAAASASICATVLPPLMLVRSASVRCVGMLRSRLRIISTKALRSRTCRRGLLAISSPIVEWLRPL